MKIPLDWLNNYISLKKPTLYIAQTLTNIGFMLDKIIQNNPAVLDIEVRQNRPDCLSIYGIARELSCVYKSKLKSLAFFSNFDKKNNKTIKITIQNKNICYRFVAIKVNIQKIIKTPKHMAQSLHSVDLDSINSIVDILNYVMFEIGLPMHAFDADKIDSLSITVRKAYKGEKLMVLGNKELLLTPDDIIVADKNGPLALAGIIGGEYSKVTSKTKNIILEGAVYNQALIRRSSQRHSIRNESSTRHEKFLHTKLIDFALHRVLYFFSQNLHFAISDYYDCVSYLKKNITIEYSLNDFNFLSGTSIHFNAIKTILAKLGITITKETNTTIQLNIPYYRTDLVTTADITEEILRIYGYDKIPLKLPNNPPPTNIQSSIFDLEESIKDIMVSLDFNEQITEPLTYEQTPLKKPIILQNALASDKKMLRTTLKNNLITSLNEYKKYKLSEIRLFEIGKIFYISKKYIEKRTLGFIVYSKTNTFEYTKSIYLSLLNYLQKEYKGEYFSYEKVDASTYFVEINIENLYKLPFKKTRIILSKPLNLIYEDYALIGKINSIIENIFFECKSKVKELYSIKLGEKPNSINNKLHIFVKVSYGGQKQLTQDQFKKAKEKLFTVFSRYGFVLKHTI